MTGFKPKDKFSELMFKFIHIFEIIVSMIIAVVIVFMIYNLIAANLNSGILSMTSTQFSNFLSSALTLVVGLEFVKLLCHNTSDNLIEVLMLAIARQMIVEHLNTREMLVGVISLVLLLFAKRHLLKTKKDNHSEEKTEA